MQSSPTNCISRKIDDGSVLVLATMFVDVCKFYLIFRNIRAVIKMKNAPLELQTIMTEATYVEVKRVGKTQALMLSLVLWVSLMKKVSKLLLGFYVKLWSMTINYGSSYTARAAWFFTLDEFTNQFIEILLLFLLGIVSPGNGIDPFIRGIDLLLENVSSALMCGLISLAVIYVVENQGVSVFMGFSILSNAFGILALLVYVEYVAPLIYDPLEDNIHGQHIKRLALQIGFDPEKIYVDPDSDAPPNALFVGLFGKNMILIGRSIFDLMDAPQVASIVAHEFGHWKHYDSNILYILSIFTTVGYGYLAMESYDNNIFAGAFGFTDEMPHPIITVYLTQTLVWPLFQALFNLATSIIGRRREFKADDYSCSIVSSRHLREALLITEARSMKNFPMFDGWFSSYFHNHPTTLERIKRIDRRERQ